jgi:vancomycin resistance protein YoaR
MTQASRSGEALGAFETTFKAKQTNRSHNIARASDSINNQIIQPGETFSYNEAVGPTSKRRGYKKGMIFIRGEKHEGYGGGVCQVSSTLYNAAANAGMTIVERHDHSRPVDYVETGNDAATSYGGVDLKFKNEKPFPVIIKSQVQEGRVSVSINAV